MQAAAAGQAGNASDTSSGLLSPTRSNSQGTTSVAAAAVLSPSSGGDRRIDESNEQDASSDEDAKVAASGDGKTAEDSDSDLEGGADEDEEDHPANDTFPFKLHRMLEHAEKNGLEDVISFTPDGRTFAIHKPREFVASIMPKYFTTSRMSSFQRQLNLYGFRRITEGRDKGAYFHKYFIKGRRALCKKVKRKKTSTKAPPTLEAQVQNSMSVRQLLAERQFGAQGYGALAGFVGPTSALATAASSLGFSPPPQPPHLPSIDASQALANAQLGQRLELLMRQRQEEERLQLEQQRQQAQQEHKQDFPPYGGGFPGAGGGGGRGGNPFGGNAGGFYG
ncbi:hypothetical protein ACA910_021889 [Epithemia clementina (nom. ined.)]